MLCASTAMRGREAGKWRFDGRKDGRKRGTSVTDSAPGALILGASSGFGEAAALAFAEDGYDIYGVHLDRRAGLVHVAEIRTRSNLAGGVRCSST